MTAPRERLDSVAAAWIEHGARHREDEMTDATTGFFDSLAGRHEPLLETTKGRLLFELENGKRKDHWLVSIDKGDLAVSHANGKADAVIRGPRKLFDKVAAGEANAMAATLRGAFTIDGDWELLVVFQRLFPGRALAADGSDAVAGGAAR
jgi:putative sterol carrier protein